MLKRRLTQICATGTTLLALWLVPASAAPAYSIVNEWHWSANPPVGKLTYCFQNGTADIAGDGERQAVRNAMDRWEEAAPRIEFVYFSCAFPVTIKIKWATGSHGDSQAFDGISPAWSGYDIPFQFSPPYLGTLAHAFPPPDGDIHFDDSDTWTLSNRIGGASPFDLETVALHELGHALGLGDSESELAIMYNGYDGSQRYLSLDDVAGAQAMYTDIR